MFTSFSTIRGSELALDLLLVDALLSLGFARVTLHVKMHPTFVSDATAADVHTLFAALRRQGERTEAWAERLGECFSKGACGYGPFLLEWAGAARRATSLPTRPLESGHHGCAQKGDANTVRAVGDALLPGDPVCPKETGGYFRAPLLALPNLEKRRGRRLLRPGLAEELDGVDPVGGSTVGEQ